MGDGRFFRFAIIAVLALLAASVAQPYVTRLLLSGTAPRPVTARGDLSDAEQSITALFERVSPSVVQVVGRQGGRNVFDDESAGVQSGTGFVWDSAGNIVTNNHVVAGTAEVAVRLATGEAVAADIVGTAPNYDLAVIRLRNSQAIRSRSLSAAPPTSKSANSLSRSAILSDSTNRSPSGSSAHCIVACRPVPDIRFPT
jgi:2-alkenal reductase